LESTRRSGSSSSSRNMIVCVVSKRNGTAQLPGHMYISYSSNSNNKVSPTSASPTIASHGSQAQLFLRGWYHLFNASWLCVSCGYDNTIRFWQLTLVQVLYTMPSSLVSNEKEKETIRFNSIITVYPSIHPSIQRLQQQATAAVAALASSSRASMTSH
jgi:hypothetical protein